MKNTNWFLIGIIVLSIVLRIVNISPLSGGDDSEYAQFATLSLEKPMNVLYLAPQDEHIRWGNYTDLRPFSRLFITASTAGFGNNDFSVLFFPIVFTAFSIWLLYLIVRKYYHENIALLSAFIFATLPFGLAFTRIGLLDAQLIFYCLMITLLMITAIEKQNVWYLYIAGIVFAINLLTTSYRGVFPLIALVPLLWQSKNKKIIIHTCIALGVGVLLYVGYALIPLLWNDRTYYEDLVFFTLRAVGHETVKGEFVSFFIGLKTIWNLFLFTPFMNFIIIPLFWGLYLMIRNIKKDMNLVWVLWAASSLIQFVQGQPYPNRQMVILPAFVVIAAYGFYKAYTSKHSRAIIVLSFLYVLFSYIAFEGIFPDEFANLSPEIRMIVSTLPFFSLIIIVAGLLIKAKLQLLLYLSAMLLISLLLIGFGVGIYKRSIEPSAISEYIKNNIGDEEYSCIAGTEASSYTYYIGKKCACFYSSDLSFIEDKAKAGDLKYFIISRTGLTVGLGKYQEIISNNISTNNIISWNETHMEKYNWIMNNTKDISDKIGLKQYMVFEYD